MNREYHRWFSENLGQDTELLIFGHAGARVLVFPTRTGRFYEYEDRGMVHVLRDGLVSGKLQLFCVDSYDPYSLYDRSIRPRERILRLVDFENYILHEVLPLSEGKNTGSPLVAHGCSLGAFHAVNIAFRHPSLFNGLLALSGRYDLTRSFGCFSDLLDGYYDEDVYFNTPSHFIPNLTDQSLLSRLRQIDIKLAIGEADAFLENNRALSQALWDKGIWHTFHVWNGEAHAFRQWREMLQVCSFPCT
ncbi:MAG TPA: alpha/beta hydrolase-fold protein [Longimicrobiaceae bacterium]|nr:alpha/beta hydrolase-fold protein [Longimicrobiaceae bacterium]